VASPCLAIRPLSGEAPKKGTGVVLRPTSGNRPPSRMMPADAVARSQYRVASKSCSKNAPAKQNTARLCGRILIRSRHDLRRCIVTSRGRRYQRRVGALSLTNLWRRSKYQENRMELDLGIRRGLTLELENRGHRIGRWRGIPSRRKAFCQRCSRHIELYLTAPNVPPTSGAKRIEHPVNPKLIFEAVGTLLSTPHCGPPLRFR
jgi:hypothetical protein